MIYISMTTRKAYFPDEDKPDDCGAYVLYDDTLELQRELMNTQAANRELVAMVKKRDWSYAFGTLTVVCLLFVFAVTALCH